MHTCGFCDRGDVPAVALLLDRDRVAIVGRACAGCFPLLGMLDDPRESRPAWFVALDGAPGWVVSICDGRREVARELVA